MPSERSEYPLHYLRTLQDRRHVDGATLDNAPTDVMAGVRRKCAALESSGRRPVNEELGSCKRQHSGGRRGVRTSSRRRFRLRSSGARRSPAPTWMAPFLVVVMRFRNRRGRSETSILLISYPLGHAASTPTLRSWPAGSGYVVEEERHVLSLFVRLSNSGIRDRVRRRWARRRGVSCDLSPRARPPYTTRSVEMTPDRAFRPHGRLPSTAC